MKRRSRIIVITVLALLLGLIARCTWRHFSGAESEKKEGPTARVEVAAVAQKTIAEKLTAYGSVIAQPGKTHSVTVGFEVRVRHILVAPGQLVHDGDALVEVEGSPAAQLQFQQAKNAAEIATRDLKQAQEWYQRKVDRSTIVTRARQVDPSCPVRQGTFSSAGTSASKDREARPGGAGFRTLPPRRCSISSP